MNRLQLRSFIFAVSTFLTTSSFSSAGGYGSFSSDYRDSFEFPQFPQLSFVGRIVVNNTSKEIVKVALQGDQCQIVTKNKKNISGCQSTFLRPGEQFTFFLDAHNIKNSQKLWLVMHYPDALFPEQGWLCYDKNTRRKVDGVQEYLVNSGFTAVEIRDTYVDSSKTISCNLIFNPNSL